MTQHRSARTTTTIGLCAALAFIFSIITGSDPARAQSGNPLLGGPHGIVKSADGGPLEGMMVQLISKQTAIRTTVFTDGDGHYEFPKLESGAYILHIAQPREFLPFARDPIDIDGANALADIVLTRITKSDVLPPYPEIAAQMTGSEWLLSLSGTGAEKRLLTVNCNWCHSYQQIFRNHYDERS
jgi:carboxypeptidase family protein